MAVMAVKEEMVIEEASKGMSATEQRFLVMAMARFTDWGWDILEAANTAISTTKLVAPFLRVIEDDPNFDEVSQEIAENMAIDSSDPEDAVRQASAFLSERGIMACSYDPEFGFDC